MLWTSEGSCSGRGNSKCKDPVEMGGGGGFTFLTHSKHTKEASVAVKDGIGQ